MNVVDRWLFAPASPSRMRRVRTALALLIAARLALSPFARLADTPDALFVPVSDLVPMRAVPPIGVIVLVQVVGVAAALLAATRRRPRVTFVVGWACLFALGGLRSSQGKILHNDVLLLVAALPFLGAPAAVDDGDDEPRSAYGWPLRAAMVVVAATYFVTGVQKLVHSGFDWVLGDNIRWVLYAAAAGEKAWSSAPARFVADRPWLATASAVLVLGTELAMPLALVSRRARLALVAAAVSLHVATWVLLGLDYWLWAAAAAVVFLLGAPLPRAPEDMAYRIGTPCPREWRWGRARVSGGSDPSGRGPAAGAGRRSPG